MSKRKKPVIGEDVPDENLRQLAVSVCLHAVDEAKDKDPLVSLDAILWLTGENFGFWADAAGIPFADPFEELTSGRVGKAKTNKWTGWKSRNQSERETQ
ncbi:MAG: hypothetical protein HXY42_03720 [Chloroflexi bacterium]|nr:hypothetical protein [Chloroflexota bacterium]